MLHNLSDLDFETSMSLNVKCQSVFGLPIYAFLLMLCVPYGLIQLPDQI